MRVRAVAALAALLCVLGAGAALAATKAAEAGALKSYHRYLSALEAGESADAARVDKLVSSSAAAKTCKRAAKLFAKLHSGDVSKSAFAAFGAEVDGDVTLTFQRGAKQPLTAFAKTLATLRWSTATESATAAALPRAEQTLVAMSKTSLCHDAETLATEPDSEPAATRKFLTRYRKAVKTLNAAASGFTKLLSKHQTASEHTAIVRINRLANEWATDSAAGESAGSQSLLAALKLSG